MYAHESQLVGDFPETFRADEAQRSSRLLLRALQDVEGLIKMADVSIEALNSTKGRIFGPEPELTADGSKAVKPPTLDGLAPQISDAIVALRARLARINGLSHELAERL